MFLNNPENFVKFIRTKQFFKQRLKGDENNPHTFVNVKGADVDGYFPHPKYNKKTELEKLVQSGQIEMDATGYRYRVLCAGDIDITLIKRKIVNYGEYTKQMRENLMAVSLQPGAESTDYFNLFLKHRKNYIDCFFTVDEFAGRVHTPIVSFKKEYRTNLLINGDETVSLDVAQMQPTLLGTALQNAIGENEYSTWINEGKDIYMILKEKVCLPDRDAAKNYFYKITFGMPDDALSEIFGAADWITWINEYKSRKEPENPKPKLHSNLSWLLQNTEVQTMRKVWKLLIDAGIIFCSVHDEIIVPVRDSIKAQELMITVLKETFTHFKINIKSNHN